MIPKKIWECVAPSTLADSSRSLGMVSKKPFISQVFTPERAAEVEQDAGPTVVLKPIDRPQVGDLGEHQVEGHDRQELREHLDRAGGRAGPGAVR